jgi:hypothetical protein
MNFKKILSIVIAVAMVCSMMAVMTASVSASNFRKPTYDRKIGAWNVNDFRRNLNEGFNNSVGVYPMGIESGDLDPANDIHVLLPEDVMYDAIGGVRVTFNLGNISADALAELPNMSVIMQHTGNSWEQHNIHIDPEAKDDCNFVGNCSNKCSFVSATNLRADIAFTAPGISIGGASSPNDYLRMAITADWDGPGPYTAGSARVQLLNKQGSVIPLFVWCTKSSCNGPCKCPCPDGCGVIGIGCKCACDDCGETRCICYCETCDSEPCICPCPLCENPMNECKCDELIPTVPGAKELKVLEKFPKWTGKGDVSAKINADPDDFIRLMLDGKEVKSSNYKVSEGSTVITLKESYLKTLDDGTHDFVAEFEDGFYANIPLRVSVIDDNDNPNSGVTLVIIPALLAAGVVGLTARRKRK